MRNQRFPSGKIGGGFTYASTSESTGKKLGAPGALKISDCVAPMTPASAISVAMSVRAKYSTNLTALARLADFALMPSGQSPRIDACLTCFGIPANAILSATLDWSGDDIGALNTIWSVVCAP